LAVDPQTILVWLQRLVSLDTSVFDDIRGNATATIPAVIVVVVSILLSGIGGWLWWVAQGYPGAGDVFLKSALFGSVLAAAIWGIGWVMVIYILLTQFFREKVFLEQLLRVMGVAMVPLAFSFFIWVPEISLAIALTSLALTFGLTTIAIQRVTTADAARVLVANLAGFLVWSIVLSLLVSIRNQYAPGVFLFNAPIDAAGDYFDALKVLNP
jgi:hypothetical protein